MNKLINYANVHPFRIWILWLLFAVGICIVFFVVSRLLKKERNFNLIEFATYLKTARVVYIPILIGLGIVLGVQISSASTKKKTKPIFTANSEPKDEFPNEVVFGIDVSHYMGQIDWKKVKDSHHPVEFVIIRSTMGNDSQDEQYGRNYRNAKRVGFICGVYHYYRPNENSLEQFKNYASTVTLSKGDLPPVLDIERMGDLGEENLRRGIKNWLYLAEQKYGVKPILYTGRKFYKKYLDGHFDDYPLWIASYSEKESLIGINWKIHQFSDQVRIDGIETSVDGNDFKGSLEDLKQFCLK